MSIIYSCLHLIFLLILFFTYLFLYTVETSEEANESSSDTVWFIKITFFGTAESDIIDDYNRCVKAGHQYLQGCYLEHHYETNKGTVYNIYNEKERFLFQESVVYPYVNYDDKKGKIFISNPNIVDIINYVESNGLVAI